MPGGLGSSYRSLTGDVYRPTTVYNETKFSVLESMKKAFSFTSNQKTSEPLLNKDQAAVVSRKMPTSANAEKDALLG
ncbi:unnamed protein product [Nezara viridula]|uniref:Uncharacterized protein n=1 Tax=Nezara viridula TaxID=85310 RepID=A0A9P0EAS9_NEZVI|nr:unnamed protein product [Nezara viridula]